MKFLEYVDQVTSELKSEGTNRAALAQSVHQFMFDWLKSHIMQIDKHIGECHKVHCQTQ